MIWSRNTPRNESRVSMKSLNNYGNYEMNSMMIGTMRDNLFQSLVEEMEEEKADEDTVADAKEVAWKNH